LPPISKIKQEAQLLQRKSTATISNSCSRSSN